MSTRGTPDMRYLKRRGYTWHCVVAVPRTLREILGDHLACSLRTQDLPEARRRRHAVVDGFLQRIEAAKRGERPAQAAVDGIIAAGGIVAAAMRWRQADARGGATDDDANQAAGYPGAATMNAWLVSDEADSIESTHGAKAADTFRGIAQGTATPILLHLDAWLREGGAKGPLNPRTAAQYRSDLKAIAGWAEAAGIATVEAITPAMAGRFVTEELVGRTVHPATANRKITAVSSYWRWMVKRAGIAANPWAGQHLAKPTRRRGEAPKRPFTDDEVAKLLSGDASQEIADAMRVAALSGMRLEEIYRIRVTDCDGGWFDLRRSKTAAGVRRIPTHTGLAEIVARRVAGKASDAFLFHEAGRDREGRERSASLSQRFGRYRQSVGVHERGEGVRHARVDFHSWRRWFVTKARNAGIDRAVVAAVVGHETGTLTDDVYFGGPSGALLRACVEAVKFPGNLV